MMTKLEIPPAGENTSATDTHASARFFNRDLSWLDFNYRVLHEAMDGRNPLLERLKFLAIFASNNDEFFMKRMAGLKHQAQLRPTEVGIDGLTHLKQYELIRHRVAELLELQDQIWKSQIKPALRQHGILIQDANELSPAHQQKAAEYFRQYVYPVLTPLAVDPGHPFPFISNLSLSVRLSSGMKIVSPLLLIWYQREKSRGTFTRAKSGSTCPGWDSSTPTERLRLLINGNGCPGSTASGVRTG